MSYVSVENRACLYGYSATYPFFWRVNDDLCKLVKRSKQTLQYLQ